MDAKNIDSAVAVIDRYIRGKPQLAIISGTGLGGIADAFDSAVNIPYDAIPGFPKSTVESHRGELVAGTIDGCDVILLSGRFHFYEGYSAGALSFPLHVLRTVGVRELLISNAAGSLSPAFRQGSLMVVRDHINLLPPRAIPAIGKIKGIPVAFYDAGMAARLLSIATELAIPCHYGVYVAVYGPSLETPAETVMLHEMGADAVGMSTVPEVVAAHAAGIKVAVVSVITNENYPPERIRPVTVEDVIQVAAGAKPLVEKLFRRYIETSHEE